MAYLRETAAVMVKYSQAREIQSPRARYNLRGRDTISAGEIESPRARSNLRSVASPHAPCP